MKKILFTLALFSSCLFLNSCLKETKVGGDFVELKLKVEPPVEYPDIDLTLLTATLSSQENSRSIQENLNAEGEVTFQVESGSYSLFVMGDFPDGNDIISINGSLANFLLTKEGLSLRPNTGYQEPEITLSASASKGSPIVFREIYYAGSKNKNTEANYNRDQYFELYNNSESVYYLDSLFIGCIAPYNSQATNYFVGLDTIPIAHSHWMFPGSGQDYPLEPGESVVIATNAVEHVESDLGLKLNKAHFAFYHTNFDVTRDPSVEALVLVVQGAGSAYPISYSSPATIIYRIPDVQAYYNDPETWNRYNPGASSGTRQWCIPQDWILDGVETFKAGANNTKRLGAKVDNSYYMPQEGSNLGYAVKRRIDFIKPNGKIKYKDSNNSIIDFESAIANPTLKP